MDLGTKKQLRSVIGEDRGVTSTEYAIIATVIAVVLVAAMGFVGSELTGSYLDLANSMKSS
ncbi:MAG: Flp family type IVb pilin [Alphaproteobacteria bacterium]|nr:Flp family type IVb pilin [Alphaproteobacteria bacterium]